MKRNIRIRNAKWIVSVAALIALMAEANLAGMINAALCMLAVCIAGIFLPDMKQYSVGLNKKYDVIAGLCSTFAGLNLYYMWQPSSLVAGIAQKLGLTKNTFLALLAIIGSAAAFYSLRCVIGALNVLRKQNADEAKNTVSLYDAGHRIGKKEYFFLLLVAALTITICSKSSPIYPFNDWVDSNCFFTVGKSMLHGKVLYRDIYEHKGIYLYVIHALAYLISNTTFFGVYLLEIVAAFAFLVMAYRAALLYSADQSILYSVPVLAAIVYGARAFCHGDSAEEFCLPLLAYALWVGMKAVKHEELPSRREYLLIGITSGCVLWIKYTMLGFYLGWYVVFLYDMIRRRTWKKLLESVGMIALGVAAVSLPVLFYFGSNRALKDLWQVYFYNNMFLYPASSTSTQSNPVLGYIVNGISGAVSRDVLMGTLILAAIMRQYVCENKRIVYLLIGTLMGTACVVYISAVSQLYYALVFAVFAASALPVIDRVRRLCSVSCCVWGIGGMLLALLLSNNTYMLKYDKQDLPQYAFKEIIEHAQQPTLLNYGFLDGGFYTVCDIVPDCKYFCKINIDLKESDEQQLAYVENGLVDFVVTRDQELQAEQYHCVAEKEFEFESKIRKYRLYARKELE